MDSFKQGNYSETSSEEIDQPERLVNDDNAGTGRSYECTFCKRGFTNAQALGGHMNIHRKDKAKLAKSKHVTSESSISNNFSKDYNNTGCNYFAPILNNQQPYHAAIRAQMNYQTYFPASNPSLFNANSEFSNTGQDYMESNLRLRIGIPYVEENDGVKMERSGDEVDLELRLGHNP